MTNAIESLERRCLLSSSTVESLPYSLDFSSDRGGITDANGLGTGFTRVQTNTAGNQYQPSLIDLNTTAGTLSLTTSGSGSNTGTANSLYNGLETQFDGSSTAFTITARIDGPLTYMNTDYDQGGIYFGPDQDNFVKLIPEWGDHGNVLQFKDELNASTTATLPTSVQNVSIGSFASINTLDLRLAGDPSTGTVSAYYAINGGSFTELDASLQLSGANKTAFFNSTSRAGILAFTRNTGPAITVTFDSFSITPGEPSSGSPFITGTRPANDTGLVDRDSFIAADVSLPNDAAIDPTTLAGNVLLYRTEDHTPVSGVLNLSGSDDQIIFQPSGLLDANTSYTFEVTGGLKDANGKAFLPYTMTFVTGSNTPTADPNIAFEKIQLTNTSGEAYTAVNIGPDGKLYAATADGLIQRFTINNDGTLSGEQTITTIQDNNSGPRTISGFAFDPSSTSNNLIMWVSNNDGSLSDAPDWSGKITKLTGANLQNYQDVITGLPRSVSGNMTEQPVFGPNGDLYFGQASETEMGAPDNATGLRSEELLSAAILQLDPTKLPGTLPLDVQTASTGSPYNPSAAGAPLTVYASGVRDAYDLLFDDNGHLYAPDAGAAANGATPASPNPAQSSSRIDEGTNGDYNGPVVPGIAQDSQPTDDYLLDVADLKYYGQPDPARYEWVLNGGNPTSGVDPDEVPQYPVGTQPDRNYAGTIYDFGTSTAPSGLIEYEGNAFGGALNGQVLVAQSSGGDDITALTTGVNGGISSADNSITGFSGFDNPVDLTEDTNTGNIYVAEYGGQKITLLKPISPGPNISASTSALYFNDIATGDSGGTGSSPAQTIKLTNNGSSNLTFPGNAITITGSDASTFSVTNASALIATTLAPGQSFNVQVTYTASIVGIQSATLSIKSNDALNPTIAITLRGIGTAGLGGSLEPSLQRILDLYQIPDNVGDNDPTTTAFPAQPVTPNDEVVMPRMVKAGAGDVSISLLGIFDNTKTPATDLGYYTPGIPTAETQLFTVPNSADSQSVDPTTSGNTTWDPGSSDFGIYAVFPAFTNRSSYSEDDLNTWDATVADRRKVRFYPLKNSDGTVVPDAYVFAFEDYDKSLDQNDVVGIIRNVKAAPAGPVLGLQNLDGQPSPTTLVFNRISNPDPLLPNVTHTQSTLKITNTGSSTLSISSLTFSGPYSFVSGGSTTSIAPAASATLVIQFTGAGTGSSIKEEIPGTLTINSNDPENPTQVIKLDGWWQDYSEQTPSHVYDEPSLAQVVQDFGYGTTVLSPGQVMDTGGKPIKVGEENLSAYWLRADTNAPVTVDLITALHKQESTDPTTGAVVNTASVIKWFYQGDSSDPTFLFQHNEDEGQSFLPHLANSTTQYAIGTFTPNSSPFGFKVDSRYSDDTLNPSDFILTDPNETPIPGTGHSFRFFALKDSTGKLIPNTYLMAMDYTGLSYSNYDYQDNIYIISNVKPLSPPSAPSSVAASSSDAGISVDWAANTEGNVVGYNVYRSDSSSGTFSLLNTGGLITDLNYTDVDAPSAEQSYYRVTAVDESGNESTYTQTSATRDADITPPAAPGNVTATGEPQGIVLNWNDNTELDLAGYNVYRASTSNGVFTKLNTTGLLTTPTYTDTAAPANVTVYYQVTAVDTSGNESSFTEVSAKRPLIGQNGNNSDMKFDANGVLHFVWYDSAQRTMQYATEDTDGSWSSISTIDSSGDDVGSYLSMDISSTGKVGVAYFDATSGDLRYASLKGSTWTVQTLDSKGSVGLYPSLQFNENGNPVIAYYRKNQRRSSPGNLQRQRMADH